jgi:hypothetical protein
LGALARWVACALTCGGGERLVFEREVLRANARFRRPLATRVLIQKLLIGIGGVSGARALPIAVLRQLQQTRSGLSGQLTVRVQLKKMIVRLE